MDTTTTIKPESTPEPTQATAIACAMCGRELHEDHPVHDATGNLYCHSCLQHLYGHPNHHRNGIPAACGLCGTLVETPANGVAVGAKGNYCPDCVARLRGERPAHRQPQQGPPEPIRDLAFEQMLDDVFSPPPSQAVA